MGNTVATIAMTADAYEHVTTRAFKNPAVWEGHLVSARQRVFTGTWGRAMLQVGASFKLPHRCPKGGLECSPDPASIGAEPSISQYQTSLQHRGGATRSKKMRRKTKNAKQEIRRKREKLQFLFCLKEKAEYCSLPVVVISQLVDSPVKPPYHKE
jgi:hypothetical protein